ncbi:MAG: glycerol-3-phosphate 1-O-acyltransferase PlsY [Alicyclobacillus sp.]|nr:glycerol-3-phosphate 1-O-acyltransferase PlsY [Alicyclobacillus sp.]
MVVVLTTLIAYLIGSISSSTLISRWFAKMDIREHGSGNAGATNTLRVLGVRWAVVVLAFDIVKGVVAVLIAHALVHGSAWALYLAGLAAIVGHNWPVFFGFRGGKGIATTIGVLLWLMPVPTALAGACAIVVILLTRYVSLGSLVLTVMVPIIGALLRDDVGAIVFAIAVALLSIWRHQANIGRLLRGQEHQIFRRGS